MLQVLALWALFLAQDPKPAPPTVEDRLKELGDRLSALEKKGKLLADENAALDKQISDAKVARENVARATGTLWVSRYAKAVQFTEAQSAGLEELWTGWTKEDMEKPGDLGRWKTREETLRSKLTSDQIPRFTKKVRDEREENAKRWIGMFSRSAKLSADKSAALEAAALQRLSFREDLMLLQAHPEETGNDWVLTLAAVEACLPELSPTLTEEERAALAKFVGQWKPKQK